MAHTSRGKIHYLMKGKDEGRPRSLIGSMERSFLVIHDKELSDLITKRILDRDYYHYETCPFALFRPHSFPNKAYSIFIFEFGIMNDQYLEAIQKLTERYMISGNVRPPSILIVSESSDLVERSARAALLEFYFILPTDEDQFCAAIRQIESRLAQL